MDLLKPIIAFLLVFAVFVTIQYAYGEGGTLTLTQSTATSHTYEISDKDGIRAILVRYADPKNNAPADIVTTYACPKSTTITVNKNSIGTDNKPHNLSQIAVYDCIHGNLRLFGVTSHGLHQNGTISYSFSDVITEIKIKLDDLDFDIMEEEELPPPPFDMDLDLTPQEREKILRELERLAEERLLNEIRLYVILIILLLLFLIFLMWWLWRKTLGPFIKPP